ncbi:MAG: 7-carboxy-7-deazaguanine synthase QueE [Gammaproteobacteria bacterium]|nr:7-carboxy-7-deazaguanine synthase QueE [Gammaproteobacteria bacterium]
MTNFERLRVTEVFHSIQGESESVGVPTVFVRLTGCPLRCGYCDTAHAFKGGEWMTVAEIGNKVAAYQIAYVTVTGGEPLAQPGCLPLLVRLCDDGYRVSLETSGALDISGVDHRVVKVMDLKTPGSGEVDRNRYGNIDHLRSQDQVKFVICDERDYQWSKDQVQRYELAKRCGVLFSPMEDTLPAAWLAEWILRDRLPVRFQIQLHKYLWGNVIGR